MRTVMNIIIPNIFECMREYSLSFTLYREIRMFIVKSHVLIIKEYIYIYIKSKFQEKEKKTPITN